MSRATLLRGKRVPVAPGGGSGSTATVYDNRFGTDTARSAASGFDTFALHASAARIWVNSTRPDDSGDGLSAATAKKTLNAAINVMWNRGNSGDQLMIAGTGGRSYVDSS